MLGCGFKKPTPLRTPRGLLGGSPPRTQASCRPAIRRRAGKESEPLVAVVAWTPLGLFEEAFVEQLRVARRPLVLQAKEQVPKVDSGDALSHELPGAGAAGAARLRGPRARALEVQNGRKMFGFFSKPILFVYH